MFDAMLKGKSCDECDTTIQLALGRFHQYKDNGPKPKFVLACSCHSVPVRNLCGNTVDAKVRKNDVPEKWAEMS